MEIIWFLERIFLFFNELFWVVIVIIYSVLSSIGFILVFGNWMEVREYG